MLKKKRLELRNEEFAKSMTKSKSKSWSRSNEAGRGAGVEVKVEVLKRLRVDLRKEEVVEETLPECFATKQTRRSA